ncbi:hypothetical protein EVJ50_11785 [Synechococcus sp. RSCCF101]|uniref:calcium-binding protein n=1 Tax=Synechococcus sp. RSCCF101 TaxID=2511069 RepID=UPI0012449B6A|nr:calcium-binding protein [Synechococcus sp. RSCCF101]QEY32810.1 hypothetical protein EVJ50_11785 [Synechococcus sp. RSCCF101]
MTETIVLGLGNQAIELPGSAEGERRRYNVEGDLPTLEPGVGGGNDTIVGGAGNTDRLVGDANMLYALGGNDRLIARGLYTELIGDAQFLKPFARGGSDVIESAAAAGSRTMIFGDAVNAYGRVFGGNDTIVSGASDDFIYGDFQYLLEPDLIGDPLTFEIYRQQVQIDPTVAPQGFTYEPVTLDLINQTNEQLAGGPPPQPGPNDVSVTIATERGLIEAFNAVYQGIPDALSYTPFEGEDPTIETFTSFGPVFLLNPDGTPSGRIEIDPTTGAPVQASAPQFDAAGNSLFDPVVTTLETNPGKPPGPPLTEALLTEFESLIQFPDFNNSTSPASLTYVLPNPSAADPLAPVGGTDLFIYDSFDEGRDVIFDFRPDQDGDRVVFQNGLRFEEQGSSFFVYGNGRDTLITFGNSSILLAGFTDLRGEHLIFQDPPPPGAITPDGGFEAITIL